jgi:hypothetical protein
MLSNIKNWFEQRDCVYQSSREMLIQDGRDLSYRAFRRKNLWTPFFKRKIIGGYIFSTIIILLLSMDKSSSFGAESSLLSLMLGLPILGFMVWGIVEFCGYLQYLHARWIMPRLPAPKKRF